MIKWFLYIVLLMISLPQLLSASNKFSGTTSNVHGIRFGTLSAFQKDTTAKAKQRQQEEEKKKVKEIAKAKKQPKPEKIEEIDPATGKPVKPKRQRRPEGLERPPEIPRRNNN